VSERRLTVAVLGQPAPWERRWRPHRRCRHGAAGVEPHPAKSRNPWPRVGAVVAIRRLMPARAPTSCSPHWQTKRSRPGDGRGPQWVRRRRGVAADMHSRNLRAVADSPNKQTGSASTTWRAPLLGTKEPAIAGTLTVLAASPQVDTRARVQPVFGRRRIAHTMARSDRSAQRPETGLQRMGARHRRRHRRIPHPRRSAGRRTRCS